MNKEKPRGDAGLFRFKVRLADNVATPRAAQGGKGAQRSQMRLRWPTSMAGKRRARGVYCHGKLLTADMPRTANGGTEPLVHNDARCPNVRSVKPEVETDTVLSLVTKMAELLLRPIRHLSVQLHFGTLNCRNAHARLSSRVQAAELHSA